MGGDDYHSNIHSANSGRVIYLGLYKFNILYSYPDKK